MSQDKLPRQAPADGRRSIEEVELLFEMNDADGNGEIDFQEFLALMLDLDDSLSHAALAIGFNEIDTNQDNRIDLAEFIDWWSED